MKAEHVSPYLLKPCRSLEQAERDRADLIAFARSLDPDHAVFNATTNCFEDVEEADGR